MLKHFYNRFWFLVGRNLSQAWLTTREANISRALSARMRAIILGLTGRDGAGLTAADVSYQSLLEIASRVVHQHILVKH